MAISSGRPRVWREEDGLSALPRDWAIYRIMEPSDDIYYVGITTNIYARISQHRSSGKFVSGRHEVHYQLAAEGVSWDEMMEWEQRKISQHQPSGVTYAGGNGRRPMIQVNGQVFEVDEDETIEDAAERAGLLNQFMRLFRR